MKGLKQTVEQLLIKHKLNYTDEILNKITEYVDALIFNIVTIVCIIAILNNENKINEKILSVGKNFIEKECKFSYNKKTKKGGGSLTYLGIQEPRYKEENKGVDILNIKDFNSDIIRPDIGITADFKENKQLGGGEKVDSYECQKCIKNILKFHNISCTPKIKNKLLLLINWHINLLFEDLKKIKPLTILKIKKAVCKRKYLSPCK